MQKVVLIGDDSYIATGLDKHLTDCHVDKLYFHNWQQNISLIQDADCVVNFSIEPDFSKRDMKPDEVMDVQIAKQLKGANTRYVFISSRKVYGATDVCVTHHETDTLKGVDFYARNKIMTERALADILGDKLTILRISNIIGEPINRSDYKTFIGWICESFLNKGKLVVTQNADSQKDFITKDFLQESIATLIHKKAAGTYNLSAGFGIRVRDVLTGYVGESAVDFQGQHLPPTDQFVLDNTRLIQVTEQSLTPTKIGHYLGKCKKELYRMKQKCER